MKAKNTRSKWLLAFSLLLLVAPTIGCERKEDQPPIAPTNANPKPVAGMEGVSNKGMESGGLPAGASRNGK